MPNAAGRPSWAAAVLASVVTAVFVVLATAIMFSAFMLYDDEGYVLLSLRNYAEHGDLYREVYTQYGPLPFVFHHALQALGLPLTHVVGRVLTLGFWTIAALGCAALVGRATRNLLLRLLVLAAVFVYLWIMASEPSHPGGLIVLLTSLLAFFGYRWIAAGQLQRWAILVGGVTAGLVLTKINIGAFVAFSAGTWWLLYHQDDRLRRIAPFLVGAAAVLLPVALMRPLLGTAWVQTYALVFAGSGIATALTIARGANGQIGWRQLGQSLAAGALVGWTLLAVVMLRGTRPSDLLEGLLLGPMRQPVNFSLRFVWPPGIVALTAVTLATAAAAAVFRSRIRWIDPVIAGLRILLALALFIHVARYPRHSPDYLVFGACLPAIWLFAWPLTEEDPARVRARGWLALLLLGQCLHVFPVPGSQIAWGSFLTLPLAALGGWDALQWLSHRRPRSWMHSQPARIAGHSALVALLAMTTWGFARAANRYNDGLHLGQPGAEFIRIPQSPAAVLRVLTHNATAHADVLFSLPGMFSFNLWTGVPTPTLANVTHWFSLLDRTRQEAIRDALAAHPRAAVIVDVTHVEFLRKRGLAPRGLLYDYVMNEFEPAFAVGQFEFRVRRGRQIRPYLLTDLRVRPAEPNDGPQPHTALISFASLVPPRRPIAQIELLPDRTGAKPLVLDALTARIELTPITLTGEPSGPAAPASWPVTVDRPNIVSIYFHPGSAPVHLTSATVVLRDVTGGEIGLARIQP